MRPSFLGWVLGLGMGVVAAGCGSDDGGDEQAVNSLQELEPLQKLVLALAGPGGFDAIQGLRISSEGDRFLPHEGARPDAPPILANHFQRVVSLDLAESFLRGDVDREVRFLFAGEYDYSEIIRGNVGWSSQPFLGNPDAPIGNLPSDRVAAITVQEMLLNPHLLVSRFGADIVDDGEANVNDAPHHRMRIEAAQPIYIFVDAVTGYVSRLDTREHDFYRRDVVTSVEYADWVKTENGGAYPATVRLVRDDMMLFEQTVSAFEVNPSFESDTFEFPAEAAPEFDDDLFARGARSNGWYFLLESIGLPLSGIDDMVAPADVAPGVWQLQGGSHHSFLVEQSAGLVLVDAPLHQDRSGALLAFLETTFPGKPVTHVVASHFHEDHVAGIRQVLGATDAALVVHESTEEFWRGILAAESTIYPDALARQPREVTIQTVEDGGSLDLPDSAHPVQLFDMNADHAEDLLLTRDVTSNSVFVVDIYSPGNGDPFEPQALDSTILDNDIPTEGLKIVGGHGTAIHTYADLEGFL
jgi:glyoxylase-like metal-dependent hydrolase (beta-lactamase superfamily II)